MCVSAVLQPAFVFLVVVSGGREKENKQHGKRDFCLLSVGLVRRPAPLIEQANLRETQQAPPSVRALCTMSEEEVISGDRQRGREKTPSHFTPREIEAAECHSFILVYYII